MPVYNYKCKSCGHSFDLLTGVGDRSDELVCTECGSKEIEKNYANFGFRTNMDDPGPCGRGGCGSCGF
jgi:putative FmdB family regulatory protein